MNNVVPLFGKKKEPEQQPVPDSIATVVDAVVTWAESNGIDIHNDPRFEIRLADFMALMQGIVREKESLQA